MILVTGATGSLGSAVMARFPGARALRGDILERFDRDGATICVHCAVSRRTDDWDDARRVNVEGTKNLLSAPWSLFVHISTISVYDDSHGETSFDEDSPTWTREIGPYAFTKAEAERLVIASGVQYVILRPGAILSMHPRSRWGPSARTRRPVGLEECATFPYVHVDDLVGAIALAMTVTNRVYNVVDAMGDTREFLEAVGCATEPASLRQDFRSDRIRRELGWAPSDRWNEFLGQFV